MIKHYQKKKKREQVAVRSLVLSSLLMTTPGEV